MNEVLTNEEWRTLGLLLAKVADSEYKFYNAREFKGKRFQRQYSYFRMIQKTRSALEDIMSEDTDLFSILLPEHQGNWFKVFYPSEENRPWLVKK